MTVEINEDLMNGWVKTHLENGLTPIPIDTKTNKPKVKYEHYNKDNKLTIEEVEKWITQGLYNNGVAILTGYCHVGKFRGLYVNCVDFVIPKH
jgi:hypothetical protein